MSLPRARKWVRGLQKKSLRPKDMVLLKKGKNRVVQLNRREERSGLGDFAATSEVRDRKEECFNKALDREAERHSLVVNTLLKRSQGSPEIFPLTKRGEKGLT